MQKEISVESRVIPFSGRQALYGISDLLSTSQKTSLNSLVTIFEVNIDNTKTAIQNAVDGRYDEYIITISYKFCVTVFYKVMWIAI